MRKQKLYPEDRAITQLQVTRCKLVEVIADIDREIEYLERAKKGVRNG